MFISDHHTLVIRVKTIIYMVFNLNHSPIIFTSCMYSHHNGTYRYILKLNILTAKCHTGFPTQKPRNKDVLKRFWPSRHDLIAFHMLYIIYHLAVFKNVSTSV